MLPGRCTNIMTGKEGVSGECPKGNQKRKSPAKKTLKKEKRPKKGPAGISVLPNLSLGKREIYQDLESSRNELT